MIIVKKPKLVLLYTCVKRETVSITTGTVSFINSGFYHSLSLSFQLREPQEVYYSLTATCCIVMSLTQGWGQI